MKEGAAWLQDSSIKKRRREVIKELRDIAENPPKPASDWNVIWVLSGPETSIDEKGEDDRGNQTRERLEAGFGFQRDITALRLNKPVDQITEEEIRQHGPTIYFNGTNAHNADLREKLNSGVLTQEFGIPVDRFIIAPDTDILYTEDQFKRFPDTLLPTTGKLAIVTDLYHIPRVRKIAERDMYKTGRMREEQVVIVPARIKLRAGRAAGETKKIARIFPTNK